jgi:hypothetical protein
MVRIFAFLLVSTLLSGCDTWERKPRTLEELVKDILEQEDKKKEAEKQTQDEKDQLIESENSLGDVSGEKQELDASRNAGEIEAFLNARMLRYRVTSEHEALLSLMYSLFRICESLEQVKSGDFSRESNSGSLRYVDLVLLERVKENLGKLSRFIGNLEDIREFLGRQEITKDERDGGFPKAKEDFDDIPPDPKGTQDFEHAIQKRFWLLRSQPQSLSESIDRTSEVHESLSCAVGIYHEGVVDGDDRLFVFLVDLRVEVGNSLAKLESVLDFLCCKFQTGESLYDSSQNVGGRFRYSGIANKAIVKELYGLIKSLSKREKMD